MAQRKKCVNLQCGNKIQYSKQGLCSWHYKELMGTYPQRPQRKNPGKPRTDLNEWDWIKDYLGL